MRRLTLSLALLLTASMIQMAMAGNDRNNNNNNNSHDLRARLSGFNEVHFIAGRPPCCVAQSPQRPAVNSWPTSTIRTTSSITS